MQCDEAALKVQALADNELTETEIPEVMAHVQSCYNCRNDYVQLLRLQRRMKFVIEEPSQEWFEKLERRTGRKIASGSGQALFIGSYILLLGYALYSLFVNSEVGTFVKLSVGGIVLGGASLFGVSILDRVRESRDDKYKGVVK